MEKPIPLLRSFLFAPGNHPRRVEKAVTLDADAVILDLEDAVATAEKVATRDAITAALRQPRTGLLYVRVNATDTAFCYGDLVAVARRGLDGIILPKVESPATLTTIDWVLQQVERERGLPEGAIDLIPIIETARGLTHLDAILATATRVKRIAFGAGDFTLDVHDLGAGEGQLGLVAFPLHVDVEREIAGAERDALDPSGGGENRVEMRQAARRLNDRDQIDRAFGKTALALDLVQ